MRRWASCCEAGDCKFPTPDRVAWNSDGCPGVAGFAHLEDGVIVMRYRYCDRRLRWERAERLRRQRAAVAVKRPGSIASGWREGD